MRAISLWQPWASACFHVVQGKPVKGIETRHWSTKYRGLLAIHAAKRWAPAERFFADIERAILPPQPLPLGCLIGIVRLVDIRPTEELFPQIRNRERRFGNYERGRFGWVFADQAALPEPIPWRGGQSFFNVPDDVFPAGFLDRRGTE